MKYQRIYLSSHVIYGSSRLGTKDYLPGQIYSLTDYTQQQPVQDTAMLRGRRPWYSEEYQDDIVYTHTEPWLATHGGMFSAAERIGEKQYELTNHTSTSLSTGLGNVMAMVSDNKYGVYGGKGNLNLEGWHPAICAAYDYYPFCPDSYRELMPDRYVSDTSRHCMTLTQPHWVWKWTVVGCKDYYEWIWPKLTLMGAATAAPTDNGILLNAQHPGDGMSFELNALPNTENQLQLELNGLDMSKNAALQILEQNGEEEWTVLAEVPIKDGEGLTVPFYPSLGKVKVVLLGSIRVFIRRVCAEGMAWVEEDQLVTICDGDGDRYRFGFNGQEKVNEWSGVGNFMDYTERGQDTRTARFISKDPLAQYFPWYSPYQFAGNTPIQAIDLDGAEPKSVVNQLQDGRSKLNLITVAMFARLYGQTFWQSGAASNIVINQEIHNRITKYRSGAITMGYEINYTENYRNSSTRQFLSLTSHELVHVEQFQRMFGRHLISGTEEYKKAVAYWIFNYGTESAGTAIDERTTKNLHDKIPVENEAIHFENDFDNFLKANDFIRKKNVNGKIIEIKSNRVVNLLEAAQKSLEVGDKKRYQANYNKLMELVDRYKEMKENATENKRNKELEKGNLHPD